MFNAANILEALKNYIHTRGGTSNAYNIAEAVNDLNSIPQGSGGDIPDEVTNAIETGGIGWTETTTEEGFDIQWDGNSEGLEQVDLLCKVSDAPLTKEQLINSKIVLHIENPEEDMEFVITESEIREDPPGLYSIFPVPDQPPIAVSALEDFPLDDVFNINRGLYFYREEYEESVAWVSKLSRESGPVEMVHQIDEKYIPNIHDKDIVVINIKPGEDPFTFTIDRTTKEARALSNQGKTIVFSCEMAESAISFPYVYHAEGQHVDYGSRVVDYTQIEFNATDWVLHTGIMYFDNSEFDERHEWTQV